MSEKNTHIAELNESTAEKLINYLITQGYPKESLITEYGTAKFRIDIAIVDPKTKIVLSIFEIKGNRTKINFENGINQLKRYYSTIGYPVSCFLVFKSDNNLGFEMIETTEFIEEKEQDILHAHNNLSSGTILPYISIKDSINIKSEIIANNIKKENAIKKEQKKKNQITYLHVLSIVLTIIFITLFILELCDLFCWPWQRLAVLGGIIVVLFVPNYQILEITGVKLHRKDKSKKANEEENE